MNADLKKNRKNDLTKNRGRIDLKRNDEQRKNEERWNSDWTIEHWVGDWTIWSSDLHKERWV